MKTLDMIVAIIANAFVIFGAIFAIYQYIKQKKLTKISNAIDLAKYFATDIIDRACLVYSVFRDNPEMMRIIDSHMDQIKNAKYFNAKEYESIFSEKDRNTYKQFLGGEIKLSNGKSIALSQILQDVINELEHCCISFNTGLAEEKAVYQSMHQVILHLFPCAYPWIGSININGVDLYYTNLCELYRRWNKIREKSLKKEAKAAKRLERYQQIWNNSGKLKMPKV